jgi:hypothetical protein
MSRSKSNSVLVGLGLVLWTGMSGAQGGGDAAAAEALFQQARDAMQAGDLDTACPKFAESHRLDPAAGTLLNLAACYEAQGSLANAWQTWHSALALLDRSDPRRPEAVRLADALESRLPKLRVSLDPDTPKAARVFRDGIELGLPSLGIDLPVDPGRHVVEVRLEGHATKTVEIEIDERQQRSLVVGPGPEEATPAATPPPPAPGPEPSPAVDREPAGARGRGARVLGISLLTLGVGGLAAGGVTGYLALDDKHAMDDDCLTHDGQVYCGEDGIDASQSGGRMATASTVGFVAGGVAVAGGVTFLLVSRSQRRRAALLMTPQSGGATVSLHARF